MLLTHSKVAEERLASIAGRFMLNHSYLDGPPSLSASFDCHFTVREAVASPKVTAAIEATGALMCFVDPIFDMREREINPALLDCSALPLFSA